MSNTAFSPSSTSEEDKLCVLEDVSELQELRDLYRRDWPTNSVGFYTLHNYYGWLTSEPRHKLENLHIYTLNGDWRKDGLYLIVDRYQLFLNTVYTLNNEQATLERALKLLNWSKGYKITSIPQKHIDTVAAVVQRFNLEPRRAPLYTYHMPKAKALKLQALCPSNYKLRRLTIDDAHIVNELWENRHPGSLYFIKLLIKYNISIAISRIDTGELIAWCTRCQAGFLGTLQVKNAYLRQGFASLVVKAFALEVAAAGDDVLSLVHEHNEASNALFTKIGFDVYGNTFHIKAFPNNEFIQWPNDA